MLWLLDDSPRLGVESRRRITTSGAVYVSAASACEIAIKSSLGKLALPDDFAEALESSGVRDLPVSRHHALSTDLGALEHRDPFDAVLIAQAKVERLEFLTADQKLLGVVPGAVDATL